MEKKATEIDILYGIEDKPKLAKGIPLAFQHILAMFTANITVPLLLAGLLGLGSSESTFLIQCALLVAGLTTLIQIRKNKKIGSGLPIVMGTSNAFLPTVLAIGGQFGIGAVYGATFVGGLFEAFLGKNLTRLRKVFTPVVSGIVVLTIGLTLIPVGIRQAAGGNQDMGNPINLLISSLVLIVIIVTNQSKNKFLKSTSILMGLVVGYGVSQIFGLVEFSAVGEASWLSVPKPLQYKWTFEPAAIVAMIFMYIATTIETIGDISALTTGAEGREATQEEMSGGVIADGISSCFAAIFNAFPNTSYSQNIGVVNLTGVFSRHVVKIGAFILITLSLLPKFSALIAVMPGPVLGGASLAMFSMVAVSGLTLLKQVKHNSRNLLIMAISLGIGLGLNLVPESVQYLHPDIQLFLTSGIVPASIIAITMDLLLPEQ